MARMVPELNQEQLGANRSRAEARFYETCRDDLPSEWVVIHSVSWLFRDSAGEVSEGEADFTVVIPGAGIVVVEVKGGGIACDASTSAWYSTDRFGARNKIKDPFKQAARERHAIISQLSGDPQWERSGSARVTVGHAVMLSDIQDSVVLEATDRPREIIGTRKDMLALQNWLSRVHAFWQSGRDDGLSAAGVRLVESVLCRSFEVQPVMRAVIDDAERQRIKLTNNQAKVLRTIGGCHRAIVAGGAGTGKTLLALEKVRQLSQQGLRSLLLCYNRPLADLLADTLAGVNGVEVLTFHQLCDRRISMVKAKTGRNLLREAQDAYPGSTNTQLFDVQMPYALALSNEVVRGQFDAVVVDEAQDFSEEYWFAVDELLADKDEGYLYVFIDQNQALYRRHAELAEFGEPFYLTANCRNTAPIHEVGYTFYQGEPIDAPEIVGPAVERVVATDEEAQAKAIIRRLGELVGKESLSSQDIVVLLAGQARAWGYDLLKSHARDAGVRLTQDATRGRRAVFVETVARFKGLESAAVVLWLGDQLVGDEARETLYVGTTRAKSLLCVVGSVQTLKQLPK